MPDTAPIPVPPSTGAAIRPQNKGAGANNSNNNDPSRIIRRESYMRGLRKPGGNSTTNKSTTTNSMNNNSNEEQGTESTGEGIRRWNAIRKDVIPNPEFMKVSAKVENIIQTLRRLPEDRTENDIKMLYLWLMNQEKLSSLFTTMSEISAKKLCKEMEFLHLEANDVVVNQGEKGNTCFIVISGLVDVYIRNPEEQKMYQKLVRSSADGANTRRLVEQGLAAFGTKVANLTPGATFGELCLIEPDSKRSATVVVAPTAKTANFIVLTAASYMRMTRSQTIEGTITDHIAFLQHTLIFKKWSKMQLMHLVNSMKFINVPAGQYLAHKGAEAESFFVILRGEAQECLKLMLNDTNNPTGGSGNHHPDQQHSLSHLTSDARGGGVQQCVTVELTYLGKFDIAGEYLGAEKKTLTCPVDIRAVTDVDCLVLSRKLFNLHFGGKDLKKHSVRALKWLRIIAEQRENWRETRIDQALRYPNFRVPITRKLMRLSGNCCVICGRCTHIAGDELCMDLATYHMVDERKKKKEKGIAVRAMSRHRISLQPVPRSEERKDKEPVRKSLPPLREDDNEGEGNNVLQSKNKLERIGHRLVLREWKAAEQIGLLQHQEQPLRPSSTPSITRSMHVARRILVEKEKKRAEQSASTTSQIDPDGKMTPLEIEIHRIRTMWPYQWRDVEPLSDEEANNMPSHERLYRNQPRVKSPLLPSEGSPTSFRSFNSKSGSLTAR